MDAGVRISYAQHGEDIVLARALEDGVGGTYVDVGAFDPTFDSVTKYFYDRGWTGINIEANPGLAEAFATERPRDVNLAVAIGSCEGQVTLFLDVDRPGWSSIDTEVGEGLLELGDAVDRVVVPMRTLSAVLDEHPEFGSPDFLKIDVEGAEGAVLAGLDLSRHRPRVIVLESVAPVVGGASSGENQERLRAAGYLLAGSDGLNDYFTYDETLAVSLRAPANPTDRPYTKHGVVQLEEYVEVLKAALADATAYNVQLEDYNRRLIDEGELLTQNYLRLEEYNRGVVAHFAQLESHVKELEREIERLRGSAETSGGCRDGSPSA